MATEQVVEQVAEGFEEAAEITRRIDPKPVGFLLGGVGIGIIVGFVLGYRWNKEKIRAEIFMESREEVEKIREFYREKAETEAEGVKIVRAKPDLEEVVEERGYTVVEEVPERLTRPPIPVQEPVRSPHYHTPRQVAKRHVEREKDKNEGWDYPAELANRSEEQPYIIHQDEFAQNEGEYSKVTLTYYAADAVLTDEDEDVIRNPDSIVGLNSLNNFGHGADDYHVVYVRNDRLEIDYEICLLAASYEETVQGLTREDEN